MTRTETYTQGNWKVGNTKQFTHDPLFWNTDVICGGIRICQATGIGEDNSKANASLISKSPTMLKTLEAVKLLIQDELDAHGDSDLLNDARNLINITIKGIK